MTQPNPRDTKASPALKGGKREGYEGDVEFVPGPGSSFKVRVRAPDSECLCTSRSVPTSCSGGH